MRRPLLVALLATLSACRRPAPPADRPLPARDATVDRADVTASDVTELHDAFLLAFGDVPRALPVTTRDGATPGPVQGGPRPHTTAPRRNRASAVLTRANGGLVWVRAVPGAEGVRLVAQGLGPDGARRDEPRVLATVHGRVASLSAHATGGHLWVAWIAETPSPQGVSRYEVSAYHGHVDLRSGDPVRALESFEVTNPATWWAEATVRAVSREDGGALVVATGAPVRCTYTNDPHGQHTELETCATVREHRVGRDGALVTTTRHMFQPWSAPGPFVEVPFGLFYTAMSDREVRATQDLEAPLVQAVDGAQPRVDESAWFQRVDALAWTGAGLAAKGALSDPLDDAPADRDGFAMFDARGTVRTPLRRTPHGQVLWAPYRTEPLRCQGGRPITVVRAGATVLTLDPGNAQQHFAMIEWADASSLPRTAVGDAGVPDGGVPTGALDDLAWTGSTLVGVAGDTALRWTCTPLGPLELVGF